MTVRPPTQPLAPSEPEPPLGILGLAARNRAGLVAAFLKWLLPVSAFMLLPFSCTLMGGSLDSNSWTFANGSKEVIAVTGFFYGRSGEPRSITVFGFPRGAFVIAPGATREVWFETGDWPLDGVLVDYGLSGPHWFPGNDLSPRQTVRVGEASEYQPADGAIAAVDDISAIYGRMGRDFLVIVLLPGLPFGLAGLLLQLRRLREEDDGAVRSEAER